MKYFGIIKKEDLKYLSINEIENYLAEINCYDTRFNQKFLEEIINSAKLKYFDELQDEIENKPCINLFNEFYEYLFDKYKEKVISNKYIFFINFEKETFGFEISKKREIALNYFNNFFENLNHLFFEIVGEIKSENDIVQTKIYSSKIFKLYMQQLKFKELIGTTENIINYLIGNADFYNDDFYNNTINIENVTNFELMIQILIELNQKYNFEPDQYFTKQFYNECKFEDNQHIFKILFGFEFTKHICNTTEGLNKATIESLYEVLRCQELIYDHKENFVEFVSYEYRLKISKIISYPYKKNWDHDDRVHFFNNELHKMKLKKTETTGFFE
jgi:hypothetical protein